MNPLTGLPLQSNIIVEISVIELNASAWKLLGLLLSPTKHVFALPPVGCLATSMSRLGRQVAAKNGNVLPALAVQEVTYSARNLLVCRGGGTDNMLVLKLLAKQH